MKQSGLTLKVRTLGKFTLTPAAIVVLLEAVRKTPRQSVTRQLIRVME